MTIYTATVESTADHGKTIVFTSLGGLATRLGGEAWMVLAGAAEASVAITRGTRRRTVAVVTVPREAVHRTHSARQVADMPAPLDVENEHRPNHHEGTDQP
jgi:hypothetical protein